ncbi:MAG: hypothetical protein ACOC45_09445 [Alkalispirochaetaceae bacterium]
MIDEILEEDQISYGNAAYLLLLATGELGREAEVADAYQVAEQSGYATGYGIDEGITLGEFSYIAMESFGVPGGLWYTLVPSPRYAARELEFRGIIQGNAYPGSPVSGERAMRILSRLLTLQEEERIR